MKSLFQSNKRSEIVVLLVISAIYGLLCFLRVGCVYRRFFGVICPGCYMTRAALALLRLDFQTAFRYHPMVFSLPIIAVYILKDGKLFNRKSVDAAVISAIGAGFVICYILRLNGLI